MSDFSHGLMTVKCTFTYILVRASQLCVTETAMQIKSKSDN